MPKKAKELSALAVSKLKGEGRYAVGGADGLHLRIAGESRAWVLRIKVADRRCDIGLGPYPEVSLAEAREAARDHRKKVRDGIDPLKEKQSARAALRMESARAKTFKDCAEAYIEAHKAGWKNDKHAKQWAATLETYAYPKFGEVSVAAVDTDLVRKAVEPIWKTKAETASRLRGRIEAVLDWARVSGYREGENPARWKGHMAVLLGTRQKLTRGHHAALPFVETGAFMVDLRKREGVAARALEFAILTAARSSEVRGATWSEIDLDARMWVIPKARMKKARAHAVPLSDAAVALLEALPRVEGCDLVFIGQSKGGGLSENGLTAVLDRMGRDDLTQHGFRSTFKDWARSCTAFADEVSELALAHVNSDATRAAYARDQLIPQRASLLDAWATYAGTVQKKGDNVVKIKAPAVRETA